MMDDGVEKVKVKDLCDAELSTTTMLMICFRPIPPSLIYPF